MAGFRPVVMMVAVLALGLAGCNDSAGPAPSGPSPGSSVRLSGVATFDFVPGAVRGAPADRNAYLDYGATTARPMRGVPLAVVADDGRELASTITDAEGRYTLTVPRNTRVRLRATARLLKPAGDGPSWDFSIRDNTGPGYAEGRAPIYAVEGQAFDSGFLDLSRNLHAVSGWTGDGYGLVRAAAPFAILDQIYAAVQKVVAVDPQAVFPPLNTYWSKDNRPAGDDPAQGEIGTSHFRPYGQIGLYILGKEDLDTDEYDSAVVVHEWGHYFENQMARSDSMGGYHGGGDVLDMRLAFGEGWGNALAGMVRDDPLYVDTQGARQQLPGVIMDVGANDFYEKGWFSESSVQYVLYQAYVAPSLGFEPIYRTMVGPQKQTEALTSLLSFATYLRQSADADGRGVVDRLLNDSETAGGDGLDIWGSNQVTLPASVRDKVDALPFDPVLPVYTELPLGVATTVCGTKALDRPFETGHYNNLGNVRYLRFQVAAPGGNHAIRVKPDRPLDPQNPTLAIQVYFHGGMLDLDFNADPDGSIVAMADLQPGVYAVALTAEGIDSCTTLTVQP